MSNTQYIESKLRELTAVGKIDLVLIDYLGLMSTVTKVESDYMKMGEIALALKDMSMQFQVPIIVLAHVNREGMKSEHKKYFALSDMGLSTEPLKHVDIIASWRLEEPEVFKDVHMGSGHLSIQGARDAETPDVQLYVNTNIMKIVEHTVTVAH